MTRFVVIIRLIGTNYLLVRQSMSDSAGDYAFLCQRCRIIAGHLVRSRQRVGMKTESVDVWSRRVQDWMFVRFGTDMIYKYISNRDGANPSQWCRWIERETVDHFLQRSVWLESNDHKIAERDYNASIERLRRIYEEETMGGPDLTRLIGQTCARLHRLQCKADENDPLDPMVASALRTCQARLTVIPMLTTAVERRQTLGVVQAWLCGIEDRLSKPSLRSKIVSVAQTVGNTTIEVIGSVVEKSVDHLRSGAAVIQPVTRPVVGTISSTVGIAGTTGMNVVGTTARLIGTTVQNVGTASQYVVGATVSRVGSAVHTIGSGVKVVLGE